MSTSVPYVFFFMCMQCQQCPHSVVHAATLAVGAALASTFERQPCLSITNGSDLVRTIVEKPMWTSYSGIFAFELFHYLLESQNLQQWTQYLAKHRSILLFEETLLRTNYYYKHPSNSSITVPLVNLWHIFRIFFTIGIQKHDFE